MPEIFVILQAIDWAVYNPEVEAGATFDVIRASLCGFLVDENEDRIVITQQWFASDVVRNTLVIPKVCIKERKDLRIVDQVDWWK